ncbi:MAG: bifunctional DNA primase/polymerase, partial [Thermodesulfobacteriota bacterium]
MGPRDLLESALGYAARGWPVFPCRPGGKVPATSDGFKSATTDAATIRAWWGAEPDANIGLWTGGAGLLVVDLDRPKRDGDPDGVATMGALVKEHGPLPMTPRAFTPSGGMHLC